MKRSTQFDPLGNRYQFDEGPCRPGTGWAQVDTRQDASYYGIWTNPKTRQILTFCEGDIIVETAENDEEYIEAVRGLHAWNDEREFWKGIDALCNEHLIGEFRRLGLEGLLH